MTAMFYWARAPPVPEAPPKNQTNRKETAILMKAADVVLDALKARGVTSKDMAETMGVRPNTLSRKISENRLTANEFFFIADSLSYDVTLTDRDGGSELKVRQRGTGRRVKRMLNGIIYDTGRADAVCHTSTENGWYIELYRDDNGRYFAAHYSTWAGADPFITVCPESEAQKLMQMYGDLEMAAERECNDVLADEELPGETGVAKGDDLWP